MQRKEVVMYRVGLIVAILVSVAACSSSAEPIEVNGNTGMCTSSGTRFSGEYLEGTQLPGSVVETVLNCPMNEMSDDRLVGAMESEVRCEYSNQSGVIVAECVSNSVVTNDGGTWQEDGGTFTITGTDIGVQGLVVQEGVRVGTGDYEGLQFVYRVEGIEHAHPWPITGTIEPTD